jgi:hypothetical protein
LDGEHAWQFLEGYCIAYGPAAFLKGTDPSFSDWNMFLAGAFVEGYAKFSKLATKGLKLAIGLDYLKQETTLDVDITDILDIFHYGVSFCILEPCHGAKLNGTTHGHKKWHLVDFHHVNTEDHPTVLSHDCDGDGDQPASPDLI